MWEGSGAGRGPGRHCTRRHCTPRVLVWRRAPRRRSGHDRGGARMQPSRPLRPLALTPLAEAGCPGAMPTVAGGARALDPDSARGAPLAGRSAFAPVPPCGAAPSPAPALYPEIALFSQFGQLFPGAADLAHYQQHLAQAAAPAPARPRAGAGSRSGSDSKTSSAYASRHQAAEQRRRTRINERCEAPPSSRSTRTLRPPGAPPGVEAVTEVLVTLGRGEGGRRGGESD